MKDWKLFFNALVVSATVLCAGCASSKATQPIAAYVLTADRLLVDDFECEDAELGRQFSDSLVKELRKSERFSEIVRNGEIDEGVVVSGRIRDFRKGSVPARIKFGPAVGNARIAVEVTVANPESGEIVSSFSVEESTLHTGPDAGRTGRESFEWLVKETSKQVAEKLLK